MAKIIRFIPAWTKRHDRRPDPVPANPLRLLFVFWPTFLGLLVCCSLLVLILWLELLWGFPLLGALIYSIYRQRWLGQLIKCTWNFRNAENPRVRLFYDPTIYAQWNPLTLTQDCEIHLESLASQFRTKLRHKLVVFYFGTSKDISRIFSRRCGGIALVEFNAMLIASDGYVQESIRHELTHLFTAKWNKLAPPLLKEGIATWLQGAEWGQPIDFAAQALLQNASFDLKSLLRRKVFFSDAHRHYILAASFSGFLIRSYGWEKYQKCFRHAYPIGFQRTFRHCMGITFETAEALWRQDIVSGNWSKVPGAKR